jgi:anthranilate phosphoribosyltransferase
MCVAAHNLGARSVMTVYGVDGVDEISLTGKTVIVRQLNGKTVREVISPEDLGLNETTPEMLAGGDPEQNARLTARILSGHLERDDPRVQIVAANAAAGLVLCEATEDMRTGVELALNAVENGKGLRILRRLIELSGGNPERLEIMA